MYLPLWPSKVISVRVIAFIVFAVLTIAKIMFLREITASVHVLHAGLVCAPRFAACGGLRCGHVRPSALCDRISPARRAGIFGVAARAFGVAALAGCRGVWADVWRPPCEKKICRMEISGMGISGRIMEYRVPNVANRAVGRPFRKV